MTRGWPMCRRCKCACRDEMTGSNSESGVSRGSDGSRVAWPGHNRTSVPRLGRSTHQPDRKLVVIFSVDNVLHYDLDSHLDWLPCCRG